LKKRGSQNIIQGEAINKATKSEKGKFMYINMDKEHPMITDVEQLKPLSNRKLWKIRHNKRLKKHNPRLERKGIF